jgi:hypothetical protein
MEAFPFAPGGAFRTLALMDLFGQRLMLPDTLEHRPLYQAATAGDLLIE